MGNIMAVCVAVIAKENYPLFIKSISADNALKFYYTVHTSLDVVEEKISSVGKNANDLRELYLGLLYPTEDYKNYPLFIKSISADNALKFYYTVHTSLDVVEEKISSVGKNANDLRELYLGLLYPTEDYKVYGYVTNTKVKFVIVVDSSNTTLRDNEIRSMFRRLHNAYVDMLSNPFYTPGEPVSSKEFEKVVNNMMVQE